MQEGAAVVEACVETSGKDGAWVLSPDRGDGEAQMTATAPEILICPTQANPELAILRNADGAMIGSAERCSACRDWLPVDSVGWLGRRMCKDGRWKCVRCLRENRAFLLPPPEGIDYTFVPPDIPKEYSAAEIHEFPPNVTSKLKLWPGKHKRMIIGGVQGSGKTYATWAQVRRLARECKPVVVISFPEAQERWTGAMSPKTRADMLERWARSPRLILDGFSDCTPSPAWISAAHKLFNMCTANDTPVLITTNKTVETLCELYGRDIASRLSQYLTVFLPNHDRRAGKE
jgi:hypothetical protein